VSIRDLGVIVEAIGDKARLTRDPALLAEYARQALGRSITAPFIGADRKLRAIALDPMIEQEVSESITQTSDGEYLAMEPTRAQALVTALRDRADGAAATGARPVLLCSCAAASAQALRADPPDSCGLLLQRDRSWYSRRDGGGC
jgi:flagellar biosynthesis protein FlhA